MAKVFFALFVGACILKSMTDGVDKNGNDYYA